MSYWAIHNNKLEIQLQNQYMTLSLIESQELIGFNLFIGESRF